MGIGAILLFAVFSTELYPVVHGVGLPTSTSTGFQDGASDLLEFSDETANDHRGNGTSKSQAELDFKNWLQTVKQKTVPNNGGDLTSFLNDAATADVNGEGPAKVITVAKTGTADFRRIQDAVNSVPDDNPQRVVIYIQSGIYREKVFVPKTKPRITFQGQGKRSTVITWGDTAYTLDKTGRPIGTYKSASVAVESDFFVAANISFQNDAYFPNSVNKYRQAVAMRISGEMAMFYSCGFFGHQDTLFDDKGSHYFRQCTIKGSVDYIFGNGKSLYERCAIRSLTKFGAITAQGRADPSEPTGFAFLKCRINGPGSPYLGRAWRDFSRVVYINSMFNVDLGPEAWSDFGHPGRKSTAYYGMYQCSGPGAETALKSGWTKELTHEEAKPFLDRSFINAADWLRPSAELTLDPTRLGSQKIN